MLLKNAIRLPIHLDLVGEKNQPHGDPNSDQPPGPNMRALLAIQAFVIGQPWFTGRRQKQQHDQANGTPAEKVELGRKTAIAARPGAGDS